LQAAAVLNRVGSCSTGKERDTESGNDYFPARYYSSSMGRWLSPDWSAKYEPVPYAKLDNPQTLNLYAYVMNNPLTRFDPDGHWNCTGENAKGSACIAMAAIHAANGLFLNNAGQLTSQREQAAEKQTQSNMAGYSQNNPVLAPGDKKDAMRMSPSCQSGNHDCTYTLSGMGNVGGQANGYYVWEHQSSDVLGGQQVGQGDYITPGAGNSPERNQFSDTLGGSNLDSYRFFTVSRSSTYRQGDQIPVMIQSGGKDFAYEHIFSTGGVVYINGSTHLQ
jgi:RHS repeat-associated protein